MRDGLRTLRISLCRIATGQPLRPSRKFHAVVFGDGGVDDGFEGDRSAELGTYAMERAGLVKVYLLRMILNLRKLFLTNNFRTGKCDL
jgi:hypothetical protein